MSESLLSISVLWLYKFYIQIYCPPIHRKRKATISPACPETENPTRTEPISFFTPIVLIMHGFRLMKRATASAEKPFSPLVQLDFVHHRLRLISNEIIGKGQQKILKGTGCSRIKITRPFFEQIPDRANGNWMRGMRWLDSESRKNNGVAEMNNMKCWLWYTSQSHTPFSVNLLAKWDNEFFTTCETDAQGHTLTM